MNDGYLLDTNIISILANSRNSRNNEYEKKARMLAHVWLPVIAIAEIEFGMAKAVTVDELQRASIRRFFGQFPQHLGFCDSTVEPYALLRSQIWKMHATREKRGGHKERVPEELFDRVTGKQLGIDERDLLIASIAAENGLILATADKNAGMLRIEEAAKKLHADGKPINFRVDYW